MSKKTYLAIIFSTLLVLAGCSALNDIVDTISSLTSDMPNESIHLSDNNPYELSSDFVSLINAIGVQLVTESETMNKDDFIQEFLVNFDFSNEVISEADMRKLLDDLYLSVGEVPDDYPLPILPNSTYYNHAFIGVGYEYDSDNTYDYWLGKVDFDQSIEDALKFYRKALPENNFIIENEGIGEEYTLGLGDAIITSTGEINNLPYEAGLLFTENAAGPNQVLISIEYKAQ